MPRMDYSDLLEETLEAWADARRGVIAEAEAIPEADWTRSLVEGARDVQGMVVHILEVAMLMTGELTRQDTNFRRAPWPELLAQYAQPAYQASSRPALLELCQTQLDEGIERFRAVGELHMLQLIERFDGRPGTRLAWLNHGIAQEMYHRGQLATYQRLLGQEPALTKRIRGA